MKSVRIIQTSRNYEKTFAALYYLDLMISDGAVSDKTIIIPLKLIKQLLGIIKSSAAFDPYISSMVKSYIRHKRQIAVNLNGLRKIAASVNGFIIQGEIKSIKTTQDDWDPKSLVSSRSNLISPHIISIFPNATSIIIKTRNEISGYPFDMFHFADSMVNVSNWKSVKIEQVMRHKQNFNKSWILKLWRLSQSELIHHYKNHQLKISIGKEVDEVESYEFFIISRS